jgi:5-(carboxyamino)imidazole ribonucleotide mutase
VTPPAAPEASKVAILMGSKSDWETLKSCSEMLSAFGVPHESRVLSAHRSPAALDEYLGQLEKRGVQIVIAAAGGAAHLAGVCASRLGIPVLGVPMPSKHLQGMDSLLSTVQMPKGVPVGTLAIGEAGAANAAILAAQILALHDARLAKALRERRKAEAERIAAERVQ